MFTRDFEGGLVTGSDQMPGNINAPFLVKLTDFDPNTGRYGWNEVVKNNDGTYFDLDGGRFGTMEKNPVIELSNTVLGLGGGANESENVSYVLIQRAHYDVDYDWTYQIVTRTAPVWQYFKPTVCADHRGYYIGDVVLWDGVDERIIIQNAFGLAAYKPLALGVRYPARLSPLNTTTTTTLPPEGTTSSTTTSSTTTTSCLTTTTNTSTTTTPVPPTTYTTTTTLPPASIWLAYNPTTDAEACDDVLTEPDLPSYLPTTACVGYCDWDWNNTTKIWSKTSGCCSTGCVCDPPSFCGSLSCQKTRTYCGHFSIGIPCCGQTTTTTTSGPTTTTTAAPVAPGCDTYDTYVSDSVPYGYDCFNASGDVLYTLPNNLFRDEAYCTSHGGFWQLAYKYRMCKQQCVNNICSSLFDSAANIPCKLINVPCVDPRREIPPSGGCGGFCLWTYKQDGCDDGGWGDVYRICGTGNSGAVCYCEAPSFPATCGTEVMTPCLDYSSFPTTTTGTGTTLAPPCNPTTTPSPGCTSTCLWQWNTGNNQWFVLQMNCSTSGGCGCPWPPPFTGTSSCDTYEMPCGTTTSNTSTTTSTSSTTTTGCGVCVFHWTGTTWVQDSSTCTSACNCSSPAYIGAYINQKAQTSCNTTTTPCPTTTTAAPGACGTCSNTLDASNHSVVISSCNSGCVCGAFPVPCGSTRPYTVYTNCVTTTSSTTTTTCFIAGTKILMADGSSKSIEYVMVGDQVMSFTEDGEVTTAVVTHCISNQSSKLVRLITKHGIVYTTSEHPFFGESGFIEVDDLNVDDYVYRIGGIKSDRLIRSKIDRKDYVAGTHKVYNLTVDSSHTYFAEGFAVHNKGGGP